MAAVTRDNRSEVIVVGGAIMGSAVAYFLAAAPAFDGRVTVIERDPGYADSATARSWGGIRQQFSTPENIRMSQFGVEFLRNAGELLAVDGAVPDPGFREQGYLFLADAAGRSVLDSNYRLQTSLGADIDWLEADALAARFPWLATDDLSAGTFGARGEGWFDPYALTTALRAKAQALGVRYVADECTGISVVGNRVAGVRLQAGGEVSCTTVVNAAGPGAASIARMAGIELPVRPRKRTTFVFDCRTDLSQAPLTVDPTGVAFRPEGRGYIAIVSPPDDRDPDATDLEPDDELFEATVWPALARRVPAFAAIKLTGAWAGHYDVNVFDRNAILGPHPEIGGFLFCNGFSGHGAQQAPASGRAIAELIVHGEYRTLDLTAFGYDRIAGNRPLTEANVV